MPGSWTSRAARCATRPSRRGSSGPKADGTLEWLLTHNTGFAEVYYGTAEGAKIEISTDAVVRTETAKEYVSGHRMYGLVDGDLLWAYDMAAMEQDLQPHLWGRLVRQ